MGGPEQIRLEAKRQVAKDAAKIVGLLGKAFACAKLGGTLDIIRNFTDIPTYAYPFLRISETDDSKEKAFKIHPKLNDEDYYLAKESSREHWEADLVYFLTPNKMHLPFSTYSITALVNQNTKNQQRIAAMIEAKAPYKAIELLPPEANIISLTVKTN